MLCPVLAPISRTTSPGGNVERLDGDVSIVKEIPTGGVVDDGGPAIVPPNRGFVQEANTVGPVSRRGSTGPREWFVPAGQAVIVC